MFDVLKNPGFLQDIVCICEISINICRVNWIYWYLIFFALKRGFSPGWEPLCKARASVSVVPRGTGRCRGAHARLLAAAQHPLTPGCSHPAPSSAHHTFDNYFSFLLSDPARSRWFVDVLSCCSLWTKKKGPDWSGWIVGSLLLLPYYSGSSI